MRNAAVVMCSITLVACTSHVDTQARATGNIPLFDSVEVEGKPPPLPPPKPVEQAPELLWTDARCDRAPISLTASDGSGLVLTRFEADAVVHGPLAFTELHLIFHNPEDRQIEGRFSVTLPEDAAISRLAMKIDGRWQEGEVVEKQAARVAYEDFLHRRQDPALMEREAGNIYSARVFPIPARGDKHLIVSYSQELAGSREPYRLPLCGLPTLAELDVEVSVQHPVVDDTATEQVRWADQVFHVNERNHTPRGDIEVHKLGASAAYGVSSGDLVIASVTPQLDLEPQPMVRAAILFDTSASRANDFAGQITRLGQLVRALGRAHPGLEVDVIAFDQEVEPVFAGAALEFDALAEAKLRRRGPLGASAFDLALDALAHDLRVPERLLLVSDGMLTTGDDFGALRGRLDQLEADGLRRVDVIVDGNTADITALTTLVRAGLPEDGVVLQGSTPLPEIVERLGAATRSGIAVEVEGATWVWPEQLDGVQPGDATLIYAQLSDARSQALRITLDGSPALVPMLPAPAPLVERARARATIAAHEASLLTDLDPAEASSIRAHIIEESVRARVLSDLTALLVLETEDDYRRFGIEREALSDILMIGDEGLELSHRRSDALVVSRPGLPSSATRREANKKARSRDYITLGDDNGPLGEGGGGEALDGFPRGVAGGVPGGIPGGVPGGAIGDLAGAVARGISGGPGDGHPLAEALLDPSRPQHRSQTQARPPERPGPRTRSEAADEDSPTNAPALEPPPRAAPHTDRYRQIMGLLARHDLDEAQTSAQAWATEAPGDVLAMVALGQALEANDDLSTAARAYGSLIDLHPSRADIRRMAGSRLEALETDEGLALAEDSYRRAVEQRPDHPSGYRLLAWVLVKRGAVDEAFSTLEQGLERDYPGDRFAGVRKVLRQDLGIVAAVWIAREPALEDEIRERVVARYTRVNNRHSLRFVLNWETDANDVDLHVWDKEGDHAFYKNPSLASGGELIADVTTGYGPEAFVMYGRRSGYPYRIMAHYYSRGAMGYGMGKLQVLEHDGEGQLSFGEHPFVVMKDDAYVDLAVLRRRPLRPR